MSDNVEPNPVRGEARSVTIGAAASLNGLAKAFTPTVAASIFSCGLSLGMSGFVMVVVGRVGALAMPVLLVFARQGYPRAPRIGGSLPAAPIAEEAHKNVVA